MEWQSFSKTKLVPKCSLCTICGTQNPTWPTGLRHERHILAYYPLRPSMINIITLILPRHRQFLVYTLTIILCSCFYWNGKQHLHNLNILGHLDLIDNRANMENYWKSLKEYWKIQKYFKRIFITFQRRLKWVHRSNICFWSSKEKFLTDVTLQLLVRP